METPQNQHHTNKQYIIAICQQKGGVGKTTTAANLGACFAAKAVKTLLIDLSPSANLTSSLGFDPNKSSRSIASVLEEKNKIHEVIQSTPSPNLFLIPASPEMIPLTRTLYMRFQYEHQLENAFKQDPLDDIDLIIIDCPPALDAWTINAMAVANLVIMPVVCEYLALQSLGEMFKLIKISRQRANPDLAYRMLITMFDRRGELHERIFSQMQEHYAAALFKRHIGVDNKIRESQLAGIPVIQFAPKTHATRDYRSLTLELLESFPRLAAISSLSTE